MSVQVKALRVFRVLCHKGAVDTLIAIKRWRTRISSIHRHILESNFAISWSTLRSRLKELQSEGFVKSFTGDDGSTRYSLTPFGHWIVNQLTRVIGDIQAKLRDNSGLLDDLRLILIESRRWIDMPSLCERCGLSSPTVRHHLHFLLRKRLIESSPRGLYRTTRRGLEFLKGYNELLGA